ncbi:hypothetical protein AVL62_04035 [Serinicoccus chungangensis]|uniref:Uncharacterized protein n=1 Tax=Serinicoccus chungangensis TaxID=767452 RepID=A0A0W8I733_9MICO|nr:hypothetical protein [Serinicoccus chungangensis]KUG54392.1 hypothetical protein AVL62_04035 [Serinicoccus chungangensis]
MTRRGGPGRVSGAGRLPAVLLRALAAWFVLVLLLGAAGLAVGAALPCEGGLECLGPPLGGALLGALAGAVAAAVLCRRTMRWWWLPTTLTLTGVAALLGSLASWLGLALLVLAPVLAGLTAVRPEPASSVAPTTGHRPRGRGVLVLGIALALLAGSWWVVERQDRAQEIAELEAVDVALVAPPAADGLRLTTLTVLDGTVRYTLARGEVPEAGYLDVSLRPRGGACSALDLRPCAELGDGVGVYRQAGGDHWVVVRDLGESHVRVSDQTRPDDEPWTEDDALTVVRALVPVDAATLVDRHRQDGD